ncbi:MULTISPECIES: DsbC family protein [Cobetia]|uniref:Thiol:disulfide interchange protein n=1 Tax=Cobetia crustatorum TaxID=553385 RepID=A0A558HDP9_9GAMM|nr:MULTISPECIES: DsbC family protein [Cobetia]TVU67261.1 DsbC family protein [Cobetia crustatorum]
MSKFTRRPQRLRHVLRLIGAGTLLTLLTPLAQADALDDLRDKLVVNGKPLPVESLASSPIKGLYEVRLTSGESFYTDIDGQHLIVGEMYRNDADKGLVNLSEQKANGERLKLLGDVSEKDMVIYRPAGEIKAVISVFTDTTCPYCRKLHKEVPELNARGIEVRYLAFPRGGMRSQGARELAQVWCAENPTEAMNRIKNEGEVPKQTASCDAPVASQYELGTRMGVQGTPAIVMPDGQMVPGYLPVDRLATMLGVDG